MLNIRMGMVKDEYLSIREKADGLFKDKGSRFISMAFPVSTEAQVKEILDGIRKEYYDARHHCYAYRIGADGSRYRANDDGEPSGSSGRPILGQIDSRNLSDVLVVVVRYFGGIKLGVPGLIRAYKTATADALDLAGTVTKIASRRYKISFGYMSMNSVMKILKDMDLPQSSQDFGVDCSLETSVRLTHEPDFLDRFSKVESCIVSQLD